MAEMSAVGLKFDEALRNITAIETESCTDTDQIDFKYPQDAVKFGEILPQQKLPDVPSTEFLEVDVGEVYDPSKFWVIIHGKKYSKKLNDMMDKMQQFYKECKDYYIPQKLIIKGLYCSTLYYGEYLRALVVGFVNDNCRKVKVFFFDYGTVFVIPSNTIRFLHRNFFSLPRQAFRARLAGIWPPTAYTQWTRESARRFLEFVLEKRLYAQVVKRDLKNDVLELIVTDTTNNVDVHINDILVKENFAIFTYQEQEEIAPRFKPIVKSIHLFPTFEELEYGLVPTASEMLRLQNVDLKFVYPHYYEIMLSVPKENQEEQLEMFCLDSKFPVRRPEGLLLPLSSPKNLVENETNSIDERQQNGDTFSPEMLPPDLKSNEELCKNLNILLALNKSHGKLREVAQCMQSNNKLQEKTNDSLQNKTQLPEMHGFAKQNSSTSESEEHYDGTRKKRVKSTFLRPQSSYHNKKA